MDVGTLEKVVSNFNVSDEKDNKFERDVVNVSSSEQAVIRATIAKRHSMVNFFIIYLFGSYLTILPLLLLLYSKSTCSTLTSSWMKIWAFSLNFSGFSVVRYLTVPCFVHRCSISGWRRK